MKPGESWPADLKAQARTLYERDGARLASEVSGVPLRTVEHWAKTEQWTRPGEPRNDDRKPPDLRLAPVPDAPHGAPKGRNATVTAAGYGFARRSLLRQLGELAGQAAATAGKELDAGHTIKARDAAMVLNIAVDKAELLAKVIGADQAGGQPETAEVVDRMRELAHDLRARRVAGNGQPG